MSKIWITSDTHFGHDREFVYGPRGFKNITEHDNQIIKNWNKVVGAEDTVFHLGDVMLGNNDYGIKCLHQLKGNIIILQGNHDTSTRIKLYEQSYNVCRDVLYADVIKYGKYHFYLSHYPTFTSNYDNDAPLERHMINLYGHTHQKTNFYSDTPFMYHVGLDSHNCFPVCIDEVIEDIKKEVDKCYKFL